MTIASLEVNLQAFMAMTELDMELGIDSEKFSIVALSSIFLRV